MKQLVSIALVGLVCCGGPRPFLDVTVESTLTVPAQADAVDLTLLPLTDDVPAETHTTLLDGAKPFPIHIVFQPADDVPHPVRVHVTATLRGAPVAEGETATALDGDVNAVTVTVESTTG